MPNRPISLETLPLELIYRITQCLSANDVAQLSGVSRRLLDPCRGSDCWKPRVKELFREYGLPNTENAEHQAFREDGHSTDSAWWSVYATLLGPNKKYLGGAAAISALTFCSSKGFQDFGPASCPFEAASSAATSSLLRKIIRLPIAST